MGAGLYRDRVMHLTQQSVRGPSGAENEVFAATGPVYWCQIALDVSPGVPGGGASATERIEDNRQKTVQRMVIKIRNWPEIRTQDRLKDLMTDIVYNVTGVRFGTNELLVNVETS